MTAEKEERLPIVTFVGGFIGLVIALFFYGVGSSLGLKFIWFLGEAVFNIIAVIVTIEIGFAIYLRYFERDKYQGLFSFTLIGKLYGLCVTSIFYGIIIPIAHIFARVPMEILGPWIAGIISVGCFVAINIFIVREIEKSKEEKKTKRGKEK